VAVSPAQETVRFGLFELDLKAGQLSKNGTKIRLPQQPLQLLSVLLERPGEILTREELRQRLWSSDVFVDFDHGLNKSIQKLRDALGDSADSPRYIETIPRVGYRFIAPVNNYAGGIRAGLELPEQESNGDVPQMATDLPVAAPAGGVVRDRRVLGFLLAVCIALLALAAGWFVYRRLHAAEPIRSLAVLPLDNLSGDPGQDYFAEGMTDELITMLAKNSTLRIVSRTSVMQYKGVHRPMRDVARELGVDGVLEGSIERTGDKVHMTIQLIQGPSDTHVWAESYDRGVNDAAALPREAAQTIAKRLNSAVATVPATQYVIPAAHDAYLRGRYLWFTDRMEESGAYFRKATEIQPDYADAWAGLADFYGEGIASDVLDPRTNMAPQEQAAQRALQLDPNLAQAHQAMAGVFLIDRWDWTSAEREILQAIRLDPNDAELYYLQACVLEALNRFPESIDAGKKEMELDPFARPYGLASIYIGARQYDAALADLQLRLEASPNNPDLLGMKMDIWRRKGNYKEAVDAAEKSYIAMGDPQSAVNLRRAYERGGAHGFVRWELDQRLIRTKSHYVSPVELAGYYAQLGDKERTLALLEEGYQQRSTDVLWIQDDPAFDFLHGEERYLSIIRRIGRPPAS
jgi:TolB-like protein/DNA-binding winged helix-turn-helix (wHTH) protein